MKKLVAISTLSLFLGVLFTSCMAPNVITLPDKVPVNYEMSVEALNKAGLYNFCDSQITSKNFSKEVTSGKDTLQMVLLNFNKNHVSYSRVVRFMAKHNMRPAKLKELQSLIVQARDTGMSYSIVALGSATDSMSLSSFSDWHEEWGLRKMVPYFGEGFGYFTHGKNERKRVGQNLTLEPMNELSGISFNFLAVLNKKE